MSNAIKKEDSSKEVRSLIAGDYFKNQLSLVTAKHITPERIVRVALTALMKTPAIADCTQESILKCLLDCASYGLEPNGRQAHLVPYGNQCTLILDYKGIAELVMRSGLVSNIHADVVCENDEFEYDTGILHKHKIDFRKSRGDVYATYALVRMKDGTEKVDVMQKCEVDAIRARSKSGKSGPWVTDWNEMAKKTVFKRCSKMLPLSPEIRDAIDSEQDYIEGEVVKPTKKAKTLAELTQPLAISASAETPEQAFQRCLAEIAGMDAKAATAHVSKFDSGDWKDEWHFELNAAIEGKAK